MIDIKVTKLTSIDLNVEYNNDTKLRALIDKYYSSETSSDGIPAGYELVVDIDVCDPNQLKFNDRRYKILKDGRPLEIKDYTRQYSEQTGTKHGVGKTGRTNLGRASAFVRQEIKEGKVILIRKT